MRSFYKSKLAPVLMSFLKAAPMLVLTSMGLRVLFISIQVISIWFIFGWVGGNVNQHVVNSLGFSASSYIYPFLGAGGFIASSFLSLLSKVFILKAAFKFEGNIVKSYSESKVPLTKGDMKNVVKLVISVTDTVVPIALIVIASVMWAFITPYVLVLVFLLFIVGVWLLKKGAIFSAKRYSPTKSKIKIDGYVGSEEQSNFYKALILPNYISVAVIAVVSISIVASLVATKIYFATHGSKIGHMAIITGVAFLQMRSFSGIILRVGAYNKSLAAVHSVIVHEKT